MRIPFTKTNGGDKGPASLVAALVLVALVPAVGVLWFMSVAMRNERLAVETRLTAVYSNHLASLQRQAVAWVTERQAALAAADGKSPAETFAAIVRAGLADSVVVGDAAGKPRYPTLAGAEAPVTGDNADWTRARALQAEAARLLNAGQKEPALARLAELVGDPGLRHAVSAQGGLIVPNAQWLMVKLVGSTGSAVLQPVLETAETRAKAPRYSQTLADLIARLNDYSDSAMSSGQRRFLMHELAALAGNPSGRSLLAGDVVARVSRPVGAVSPPNTGQETRATHEPSPASRLLQMLAAEDLAADYLERDPAPAAEAKLGRPQRLVAASASERAADHSLALAATGIAGVWRLPGDDRTVVALFHQQRLRTELEKYLAPFVLPDARVTVLFPSAALDAHPLALARDAGELLPGWRLALGFRHVDPFAEASALQTRLYLWTGVGVVAIIAVVSLLVARYVAAQVRLARMKNELVSTVSHELKTPLASMRALVDTLSAGRYRDEAQLRDYLQLIARENLRLSHLIENFLAFSRMERGPQQLHFAELPPQEVVRAALDALGERLAAPACDLTTYVAPGLPPIRGDADALTSVLVNLLDNACKYTSGEKRIAVRVFAEAGRPVPDKSPTTEDRPQKAQEAQKPSGSGLSLMSLLWPSPASTHGVSTVVFEISDNGIGIAREEQRRIFERFYQVDQSLTRQRGGCGLGLSIVDHIVRAHGGTIEVESAPGRGSTFRVKIPVVQTSNQETTNRH